MQQTYELRGLTCANCAKKIERQVSDLPQVASAIVDVMNQRMTVECKDKNDADKLETEVRAIVSATEPDVSVTLCNAKKEEEPEEDESQSPWRLRRLIGGGILCALGVATYYTALIPFTFSLILLLLSYLLLGYDVLWKALRHIARGQIFDENFLMAVASIGAFLCGEYPEAAAVMLFYQIGEYFQDRAVNASRRDIRALIDIRPDSACVMRNGEYQVVKAKDVHVGETMIIKPGERVPLDGKVLSGESSMDTKALTGESLPRHVSIGDTVLSGMVNTTHALTVEVIHTFGESTATKIVELVQKASSKKAPAENFITVFARYYTPVVVLLALLLAILPPLFVGEWMTWIHRALVFLVISCPCALVISIPLSYFAGIGAASRRGILVKGGNYLDALHRVRTVVFDKTGTLTRGVFEVTHVETAQGVTEDDVIRAASVSEFMSTHPIARSILAAGKARGIDIQPEDGRDTQYHELSGMGVEWKCKDDVILVGNERLMASRGIEYPRYENAGSPVYVAKNGRYYGCLAISDVVKPEAKSAISHLRKIGVTRALMFTGDTEQTAAHVAQTIGLDGYEAALLPADKVQRFESLTKKQPSGEAIAFVGDGINDAPVLARADIGIAMGGIGSDAAIEAADVVLMTDELQRLPEAIDLSYRTRHIVLENIIFALSIKFICLILGALGIIGMWAAVFADVGVMIIAVLNAMRLIFIARKTI